MRNSIDDLTGLYMSAQGNPYGSHPFPYNIKRLREYLKKTGKSMNDLTVNEFNMFSIAPIKTAN